MDPMTIFWLALAISMIVVELSTVAMVSIWFAGGAGAALLAAILGAGKELQWIIFAVVSFAFLILFRKKMVAGRNSNVTPTNVDRVIGMKVRVIETISNSEDRGAVEFNGQEWTARNADTSEEITEGSHAVVERMEGNTLYVKKAD